MSDQNSLPSDSRSTRRTFIRNSSLLVAGGAVAGPLSIARGAHVFGSDEIKIGLVGCGGRGHGAAANALETAGKTKVVAMADTFGDQITHAVQGLSSAYKDKVDVPADRQFVGLDAYKQLLMTDIDIVILATPPGFRPLHFEAAVKAGKHVFMEKPVAVDAAGVRKVLAANEIAKSKNLAVAVGLQRRHEPRYIETIKRLHDGAIGDVVAGRVYWNGGYLWVKPRKASQNEMEFQIRNWYYFNWLCGDHIVEQHIHNLDVMNWVMNGYPLEAQGQGGRQVRVEPMYGQIYDHHFVEFSYGPAVKWLSQCRHIDHCWNSVSEHVHGTQGYCDISGAKIMDPKGKTIWEYGEGGSNGHQQEHHDLFAVLRKGEIPNEGEYGAKSSMTAIMGRMATYSGNPISWKAALESNVVVAPVEKYSSFEDEPPVLPDEHGYYPIPMPGKTKVV